MFRIIFAQDKKGTIGSFLTNSLPWSRKFGKEDMRYFRDITIGNGKNAVIMGHNTFMSLPKQRGLSERSNIVVTRSTNKEEFENVEYITDTLQNAIQYCLFKKPSYENVFIIGGAAIYNECYQNKSIWNWIDRIHCTTMQGVFEGNIKHKMSFEQDFVIDSNSTSSDGSCLFEIFRRINHEENSYLQILQNTLQSKDCVMDRTGTGIRSQFGQVLRFDLSNGRIPLLTTKRVFFRGSIEEMLFFISGSTDVEKLRAKKVHIWDGNTTREFLDSRNLSYPEWDMGPTYSFMFKHAGAESNYTDKFQNYEGMGVDQLQVLVDGIRKDPFSRRHMINLWSPSCLDKMSLPPCLFNYMFHVTKDNKINLLATMRSADLFLGVPFNLCGATLILRMLCHLTDYTPGQLMLVMNNAHIYENHVEQVQEQCSREPYVFPMLDIKHREQKRFDDFVMEDFTLLGYKCHKTIKAPMAV